MELLIFKFKSGIKIKPSHKGLFTDYCGGKVTSECIAKGKRSPNAAIRKRATFALNARRWKHESGGSFKGYPSKAAYEVRMEEVAGFKKGGLILKHLLGNIIGPNPMATLKAFDKLWNIGLYTKDYITQKIFGKKKSGFIDLSNKKVSRINKDTKNVESILTNDFVERKNNSYRKRKDFENTTDTIIGDRNIPLSKISTFYGIENRKLKAGPLDTFNLETIVVPNRAKNIGRIKYISPGERVINKGAQQDSVLAEWRRYNQLHGYTPSFWLKITGRTRPSIIAHSNMDKNDYRNLSRQFKEKYHDLPSFNITYKNDYAITENGDTIKLIQKYLNAKPKIMFANEKGNGIFVSNLKNNLNKVNEYLSKHPSYPIMVDNGRNANYIDNNANIDRYVGPLNSDNMYILGTVYKQGGILRYLEEGGKNDSPAKTSWIKKAWGNLKDSAKEALPGLATDLFKVGINKILDGGNNSSNELLNLSPMETFRNLATAENNYAEIQLAMNPIFNASDYGETINYNPDLNTHWNWELKSNSYMNKENSMILLEKILEAQRILEEGSTLSQNLSTLLGKGIDLLPGLIGKKSKISIPTSGGLSNNNTTYTSAATGITASVDDWRKAIQG